MKISRENLTKALEVVKPGLSNKEMIEQSSSFCFVDGHVVTFNDEVSVRCPLEGVEITGAISSTEIYNLLTKLKAEEIDVEILENELILKCGKIKAGIRFQPDITLPIDEIGKVSKWKNLPKDFIKGLSFTMGSCGNDMTKPLLTCVHIAEGIAEATDNFRIMQYTFTEPFPIKEKAIPARICTTLVKMKPTQVAEGENGWIHFKTKDGVCISCRYFDDVYPDLSTHLKIKGKEIIFPDETISILERAGIFSKRDHIIDEFINISIDNNKMVVGAKNDSGWFEEKAKINFSDAAINFNITPYLLRDILQETNKGKYDTGRLGFIGENWKYLSLLRS